MKLSFCVVLLAAAHASAEPIRLRMSTAAPEGSSWAHEFDTLAREVSEATRGEVQIKWYKGGITGDEVASLERVRRNQLDGVAGALFCDQLAPSMRVGRIVGLFQSRDEWQYVMSRLLPDFDREFARAGFANLAIGSFGNIIFFTRKPVRSYDDLKKQRLWTYGLDLLETETLHSMGLEVAPMPLDQASPAYDRGDVDGFVSTPTAALAFQWSARARFYTDLVVGELPGCFVVAERALDLLSVEQRKVLDDAVAKFTERFRALGTMQDDALLNGLFERQGLHREVADAALRASFLAASRVARDRLTQDMIPHALLVRTLEMLADYRSEHNAESVGAATSRP